MDVVKSAQISADVVLAPEPRRTVSFESLIVSTCHCADAVEDGNYSMAKLTQSPLGIAINQIVSGSLRLETLMDRSAPQQVTVNGFPAHHKYREAMMSHEAALA